KQVGWIVQRRQWCQRFDRLDLRAVEDGCREEVLASVNNPVSHGVESADPMIGKNARQGMQRGGDVAEGGFSGLRLSAPRDLPGTVPGLEPVVARLEDLLGCLSNVENAELEAGTTAVHYKYLHGTSF